MAADVLSSLVALLIEPLEKHPRMSEREALIVQLVCATMGCGGW